jgi:subtilisin family serine protease/PKD repeat protein
MDKVSINKTSIIAVFFIILINALLTLPAIASKYLISPKNQSVITQKPIIEWQHFGASYSVDFSLNNFTDVFYSTFDHGGITLIRSTYTIPDALWQYLQTRQQLFIRVRSLDDKNKTIETSNSVEITISIRVRKALRENKDVNNFFEGFSRVEKMYQMDDYAPYVPKELLIQLKEGVTELPDTVYEFGFPIQKITTELDLTLRRLQVSPEIDVEEAISKLENDSDIEIVEPNLVYQLESTVSTTVTDPQLETFQWAPQKIKADAVWDSYTGSGVLVAVIDTGITTAHTEFSGNGKLILGPDFGMNDNEPFDHRGHGTHVAGIIAANADGKGMVGIAPGASILVIKCFHDRAGEKAVSTDATILSIHYAISRQADIINMSLGTANVYKFLPEIINPSKLYLNAIKDAINAGVVVVTAAGNDMTSLPIAPGSLSGAIMVAATRADDMLAPFSNHNPSLSLSAPGLNIYAPDYRTSNGYCFKDGTSMAAPVVSGAVALLLQKYPDFKPLDVKKKLEDTADDLGTKGFDGFYGAGRINIAEALGIEISQDDYTPPQVVSFEATPTTVTVIFSKDMLVDSSIYSVTDTNNYTTTVTSNHNFFQNATYSYSKRILTITNTTNPINTWERTMLISTRVKDMLNIPLTGNYPFASSSREDYTALSEPTHLTIKTYRSICYNNNRIIYAHAIATDDGTIKVLFNQPVIESTAENSDNYTLAIEPVYISPFTSGTFPYTNIQLSSSGRYIQLSSSGISLDYSPTTQMLKITGLSLTKGNTFALKLRQGIQHLYSGNHLHPRSAAIYGVVYQADSDPTELSETKTGYYDKDGHLKHSGEVIMLEFSKDMNASTVMDINNYTVVVRKTTGNEFVDLSKASVMYDSTHQRAFIIGVDLYSFDGLAYEVITEHLESFDHKAIAINHVLGIVTSAPQKPELSHVVCHTNLITIYFEFYRKINKESAEYTSNYEINTLSNSDDLIAEYNDTENSVSIFKNDHSAIFTSSDSYAITCSNIFAEFGESLTKIDQKTNDGMVSDERVNIKPQVYDINVATTIGQEIQIKLNAQDADSVTYAIEQPPFTGTIINFDEENGTITYQAPDYKDTASFTFYASEGKLISKPAQCTIHIYEKPTIVLEPVNNQQIVVQYSNQEILNVKVKIENPNIFEDEPVNIILTTTDTDMLQCSPSTISLSQADLNTSIVTLTIKKSENTTTRSIQTVTLIAKTENEEISETRLVIKVLPSFDDVDRDYWASHYIYNLASENIVTIENSLFRPNVPITRIEALKMVYLSSGKNPPECQDGISGFDDIGPDDESWWCKYAKDALDNGYVEKKTNFRPQEDITRAETVKLISNIFDVKISASEPYSYSRNNLVIPLTQKTITTFPDITDHWCKKYVHWMANVSIYSNNALLSIKGTPIISGYGDKTFKPNNKITRTEIAKILSCSRLLFDNLEEQNTYTTTIGNLLEYKDFTELSKYPEDIYLLEGNKIFLYSNQTIDIDQDIYSPDNNYEYDYFWTATGGTLSTKILQSNDFSKIVWKAPLVQRPTSFTLIGVRGYEGYIGMGIFEITVLPIDSDYVPSQLFVKPEQIHFLGVPLFSDADTQYFYLSNTGNSNLVFKNIQIENSVSPFKIVNDTCSNRFFSPSKECRVGVIFTPETTGLQFATLNIPSNDPKTPVYQTRIRGIGIPENATMIRPHTPVFAKIEDSSDIYYINVIKGNDISVAVGAELTSGNIGFSIVDLNDHEMVSTTTIQNNDFKCSSFNVQVSGVYLIKVNTAGAIGAYTLTAFNAWYYPSISTINQTFNATRETAFQIDEKTYQMNEYQKSYHRMLAEKDTDLSVSITADLTHGHINFSIINTNDIILATSNDPEITETETATAGLHIYQTGIYYVKILGYNAEGSYTITVNGAKSFTDTDKDGLCDAAEFIYKTNNETPDTNNNNFSDTEEIREGRNPIVRQEYLIEDLLTANSSEKALPVPYFDAFFHMEYPNSPTWFSMTLRAKQKISMAFQPYLTYGTMSLELYDNQNNLITVMNTLSDAETAITDIILEKKGLYFLKIEGTDASGHADIAIFNSWRDIDNDDRNFHSSLQTAYILENKAYTVTPYHQEFYRFFNVSGNGISLKLTPQLDYGLLHMSLINSFGKTIASTSDYTLTHRETGSIHCQLNENDVYYLKVWGEASGYYHITTQDAWYNPGSSDNYQLPNHSFETSWYLKDGIYSVTDTQEEYYRFIANRDETIEIQLTANLTNGLLNFGIFDLSGDQLVSADHIRIADGQTATATKDIKVSGLYYVKVRGYNAQGTYALSVSGIESNKDTDLDGTNDDAEYFFQTGINNLDTDDDEYFDKEEINSGRNPRVDMEYDVYDISNANILSSALPVKRFDRPFHVACQGKETWFSFSLQANQGISVALQAFLDNGSISFGLYKSNGTKIIETANPVENKKIDVLSQKVSSSGTYYIKISGDVSGYYELGVYQAWFNGNVHDFQRNFYSTMETARAFNAYTYTVSPINSEYYRINAIENQGFTFQLNARLNKGYLMLDILNQSGELLQSSKNEQIASNESAAVSFCAPKTDVYYVRVSGNNAAGYYGLKLADDKRPVANTGGPYLAEMINIIEFTAENSSDDYGISEYHWQFGDGTTGDGPNPKHIYWQPGAYPVTLTVYDGQMQSDTKSLTVNVIIAEPPVAHAGTSYQGQANGHPVYFDGSQSTDDFAVIKYLWDVDDQVDSDSDGNKTNDIDIVGEKPMYVYSEVGQYTATLTVVDGPGHQSSDQAMITIVEEMVPDVICVPWNANDPTIPHETYSDTETRLKAIVRGTGTLTYQWDFGDNSELEPLSPASVPANKIFEVDHIYSGFQGERYTAKLTVCNENQLCGTDEYYVIIKSDNLKTRTNIAVDNGLWYLYKNQNAAGSWSTSTASHGTHYASPTASSIQAFEVNGHLQDGNHKENPYVNSVVKGFDYMFTTLTTYSISAQFDTNSNNIGVQVLDGTKDANYSIYQGGMIMDAIASSSLPLAIATKGNAGIQFKFYHEILTDMVDMYGFGQNTNGGWRYSWNYSTSDNSACQWAAIGMMAAEDNFGIQVPDSIKTKNKRWLDTSYHTTNQQFGYKDNTGATDATTPSGLVQIAFCDLTTYDSKWKGAQSYLSKNWNSFVNANNYYAVYALIKAFRLALPKPVSNITIEGKQTDWYYDENQGINQMIVKQQSTTGSWDSAGYGAMGLDTPWAIIMLTPTLFVQPPVANAGDDIIWGWGIEMTFDASKTMHIDTSRNIVKYEWDFNGDGEWDVETKSPVVKYTYYPTDFMRKRSEDVAPQTITMRLRVTDDNDPPQTDIATRKITLKEPPFAPYAKIKDTDTATAGIPVLLDGSESFDIDSGDYITLYEWDLDNDGNWFDDIDFTSENSIISYTFQKEGIYNIGLRVTDSGAGEYTPMTSIPVFSTVTVEKNITPLADAGGPYTAIVGQELKLDAADSYDSNADTLTYLWDLDNDGHFDDAYGISPLYTWNQTGTFTIGLQVSDMLASDTTFVTVTVSKKSENDTLELRDVDSSSCFISTCQSKDWNSFWNKIYTLIFN